MKRFADVRSRRVLYLVAAVCLVALVAVTMWFLWLPTWRPALRPGERHGIDVSAHQGKIDWESVAADGIDVAYIKATEGGDFVDDRFAANWRGSGAAGVEHGAYHFFTLCTGGTIQAANFLSIAPPRPDALPPAVDLELAGNCADRPDDEDVGASLREFLALVEGAWRREAVLYVGDDWEREYRTRDVLDRPLWLRRFFIRPDGDWVVWQLHGWGRVDGIDGPVDLDVMRHR